jgi:nitrate reductase gamma subunit
VLPTVTVALLSLLIAYIPLTHMSHFIGKYFAYHSIRWNDTPNLAGGPQEPAIQRLLSYRVSWAAPHIHAEGNKTWADLAASNPTEKKP